MSDRSRPRGPATPPEDDPSIPVLTERLTLPALEIDFTLPPLPPAGPAPQRRSADTAPPMVPLPTVASPPPAARGAGAAPVPPAAPRVIGEHAPASGADAGHEPALAADLRDAVLSGVRDRVPQDVERLVRERFAPTLDGAVRAALEQAAAQLATQVSAQLASQLAAQMATQLATQLAAQVAAQIAGPLASQLAPQIAHRIAAPLSAQVIAQVAGQVTEDARRALSAAVTDVVDHAIAAELDRLRAGGR